MLSTCEFRDAKILVVDDLQSNNLLLIKLLGNAGYTLVSSTNDPHAVCSLHKENLYDLILLDLLMPEMDGFEVMNGLKELEQDSYLPVMVISADSEQKQRAFQSGAKDFISKPFDQTDVLIRVHNMLQMRLLHRTARTYSESLTQKVSELEASYQVIRRQSNDLAILAESGHRAKREFLTNMSHELRTPLNGVIGMIRLLLESPLNERQREFATIVYESGQSLLSSINDILNYEHLEQNTLKIEEQDFELDEIIQKLISRLKTKASEKRLEISTVLDPSLPECLFGHGTSLQQVLRILFDNALKFTAVGKIVLSVNCLSRTKEKIRLHFSIADTGIGIAAGQIEAVFQPFNQVDSSTSRVFGGKGLGLSIAKELVELMGGQLDCQSKPGQGSCFAFSLWMTLSEPKPVLSPPSQNSPVLLTSTADGHPVPRILLVEDNEINQVVATAILTRLGFLTDISINGLEALAALKQTAYDLVLMDCQMPEMDGYEATRAIRNGFIEGWNPDIPIIAVTAHVLEGDRARCLEAGMNDYLPKPFTSEQLAKLLTRWLPLRK